MHRQAFRLKETVLGKEHPNTLASMSNLANVLSDQGKYEQAEETHRQALGLEQALSSLTQSSIPSPVASVATTVLLWHPRTSFVAVGHWLSNFHGCGGGHIQPRP